MNEHANRPIFKISLLSMSLLLMLAPTIAPALPMMISDFPEQSKSSVELLLTVPNFGIILALFVSPFFIKFTGKKVTVIIGLILALLSGALPIFTQQFTLIFISRFMFGFGIGLFNSLAVSLLADYYEGDDLSTMMGFQAMTGAIGAAGASFAVSFLITKGWQASFSIYLIILPVLILFALFVPIKKETSITSEKQPKEKQVINSQIWSLVLIVFGLFTCYMVIPVKLPELVLSKGLGSMSSVSIITGISTLVGIPIGMMYGKIHQALKDKVLIIGLTLIPLGLAIVCFSPYLFLVALGVMVSGIGFGLSLPFIYTEVARVSPSQSVNLAYTYILISTNIGVFASPLILNTLGSLFHLETAQGSMIIAMVGLIIILTLVLITRMKQNSLPTATIDPK